MGAWNSDLLPHGMQKIASDDKSRKDGKDQESIQSSSKPDPRHHKRKRQKHKETSHTTDNSNLILEKNY